MIGNVEQNQVPDRELTEFLSRSLSFLADYLKFVIVTDTTVPLVANQMEYPLPKTFLYMQWVEIGGQLLQPTSTWAINSGQRTTQSTPVGPDWRTAVPSKPLLYAVEGRELILNPPPDSGTAASFPTMVWRYIGTGTEWAEQSEIGMGQAGIPSISDADEDLVTYEAAIQWCAAHPSPENKARLDEYRIEVGRRLPAAKRRWENMIRDYAPTWRPDTSGRMYAAR